MKTQYLLLFALLSGFIASCDSPKSGFERENPNDPLSLNFKDEGHYDMSVFVNEDGMITVSWGKTEDFIERLEVKKSLGDTLNFTTIGNVDPNINSYRDSSQVIDREIFYQIETYYTRNGVELRYGLGRVKLRIGQIHDFSLHFDNEGEKIDINWSVDVPYFSYLEITSENSITESGENRVHLPNKLIQGTHSDPLPDVAFSTRTYKLKGVIELGDGKEDIVVEKKASINLASLLRPENATIDILNEQDWVISWKSVPFFSEGIKLERNAMYGDMLQFDVEKGETSFMDSTLSAPGIYLGNSRARSYYLSFISGDSESESVTVEHYLEMSTPFLKEPVYPSNSPGTVTLNWGMHGRDNDKVKEFIIEKSKGGDFYEISRLPGNIWEYADNTLNSYDRPVYRIRSTTTDYSDPKDFGYVNNYNRILSMDTDISFFKSIEISSDYQYLTGLSDYRPNEEILLKIWDINSGLKIHVFDSGQGEISDFKISHDDSYIYYVIPEKRSIFRADFPDGGNLTEVIREASQLGEPVRKIDISRDGEFLLGTGGNYFVKRWNLNTYELKYSVSSNPLWSNSNNIAISGDNTRFVMSKGPLHLKDVSDGETIREFVYRGEVKYIGFSANDSYVSYLTSSTDVYIFSVETQDQISLFRNTRGVDFDPRQNHIVAMWESVNNYKGIHSRVYFYDLKLDARSGVVSDKNVDGPEGIVSKVRLIDSNRLAVARFSPGRTLEIWEKAESRQWKIMQDEIHY